MTFKWGQLGWLDGLAKTWCIVWPNQLDWSQASYWCRPSSSGFCKLDTGGQPLVYWRSIPRQGSRPSLCALQVLHHGRVFVQKVLTQIIQKTAHSGQHASARREYGVEQAGLRCPTGQNLLQQAFGDVVAA